MIDFTKATSVDSAHGGDSFPEQGASSSPEPGARAAARRLFRGRNHAPPRPKPAGDSAPLPLPIPMPGNSLPIEQLVEELYLPLFKFAHRLCGNPVDAQDFTQEAFYLVQIKGHQLHTPGRVKSWLFTTLYREFLKRRQRRIRFPEFALEDVTAELPEVRAHDGEWLDAQAAWRALMRIEERYRRPLILFYLENKSYREIALATCSPIGTVMSRISRGKQALASLLNPVTDALRSGRKRFLEPAAAA